MRRLPAIIAAAAVVASVLVAAPAARAQSMVLDPALPAPQVSTTVAADGTATISLTAPPSDEVCVWGIEWDAGAPGEHATKPGLRPGGRPPEQNSTVPPVCGTGTLPTTLTLSPAEIGAAGEIRIRWAPVANVWTFSPFTVLSWPLEPDQPADAPTIALSWSPELTLRATAVSQEACHWRFEWRLAGAPTWTGAWVGGEPGQPCASGDAGLWDAPEDLWTSAIDVRAAYTSAVASTTLSAWAEASYAYSTASAPNLLVDSGGLRVTGAPPQVCRVAVSWLIGGSWTSPAAYPMQSCGLPGVGQTAPLDLATAPEGAKQVRIAYLTTPAASSRGAWSAPIVLGGLLAAQDVVAVEQPNGSITISFTDPNPVGAVCAWRWELRRVKAKNVFGAGSSALAPGKKAPCSAAVSVPAALDDPANLDLVLWPDSDGANDPADKAPKVFVTLPDVDRSDPVTTGSGKGPTLSLSWWTSQSIEKAIPRARVGAPEQIGGTCSYRLQWKAKGVAPRGSWVTGPCAGTYVELPQLAMSWASTWSVQAAWAKGVVGAKPGAYSSYTKRTWASGSGVLNASTIQVTSGPDNTTRWFVTDVPVGACNAQVQLLSTTSPETWEVVSDAFAAPLGLCDDLWAQHVIPVSSAKAIRVRMTSSTADAPVGRWMYASLVQSADAEEVELRWNDAGVPVIRFVDPNPPGDVCFWQVRLIGQPDVIVQDVSVAPDGSTGCSGATSFVIDGPVDWRAVTGFQIRPSLLPEITAIDGWGPLAGSTIEYSPRLVPGKGKAPSAGLAVDEYGYHSARVTGKGCRFIAQWRVAGESLWRTEALGASTTCSKDVALSSLKTSAAVIEARVANAKIDGAVVRTGAWSAVTSTTNPMPVPEVTFYPGTNRVRVDNQPASLCGTWFEVRRAGTVVVSSVVRGAAVTGPATCGPWEPDSRMTTYVPAAGDEVRFAFMRGVEAQRVYGAWTQWLPWPASDTVSPSVQIIAPADGSSLTGAVAFRVAALDEVGIDRVEIRSGTRLLGVATRPMDGAEYRITWDSWTLPNGVLAYTAVAIDTAGNETAIPGNAVIANPSAVEGAPSAAAKAIAVAGSLGSSAAKALRVTVPRGQAVRLRLSDSDLAGGAVLVRLGKVWTALGKVDAKRFLPTLRVNGPDVYLVRVIPKTGKARFLALGS